MKPIERNELEAMRAAYLTDDTNRIVRNALKDNDVEKISLSLQAEQNNPFIFSHDIKTMKACNQMKSGRCWIFSAMNVLREMIAKKYQIEDFELSQNFIAYYDKLEKVNWLLNCLIEEKDAPLSDRTNEWLLTNGISDGGQWDMLVSVVKKYGICPKTAMPETYTSSHTQKMNTLINKRIRKFAIDIRKTNDTEEMETLRNNVLEECHRLINDCFGVVPETFDFEYRDKDSKYHRVSNLTPLSFYKDYLAEDLDQYVVIINAPTEDKPFHKMYSVKYIGNVVDGNPIRYLNLPMDEFKAAVIRQLKDEKPVWFGCDCSKDGERTKGLWDDQAYDYAHTFGMNLEMSKAEMLDARESAMNHAMVLTGVNLVDEKSTRWKIENSWGEDVAQKGYYTCSDTWFDLYVYECAIHKDYLTKEQVDLLNGEVNVKDPWDPFGTLAD